MKDKYIRDTQDDKTVMNMRHPDGNFAELPSGVDDSGNRWWVVPFSGRVYDWPTARAKCLKIFGRAGYKVVV